MANADSSATRLHDIWIDWGLAPDVALSEAQKKALEPLEKWLLSGKPDAVVSAVQTLLADPERPGANRRASVKRVLAVISDVWPSAGAGGSDLYFVQGMLLSVWKPHLNPTTKRTASLFRSAWETIVGRERQKERLREWSLQLETQDLLEQSLSLGSNASIELPAPTFTLPADHVATTDGNMNQLRAWMTSGVAFNQFGPHLVPVLESHRTELLAVMQSLPELRAYLANLSTNLTATIALLSHQVTSGAESLIQSVKEEVELLWWGQARYCHTLRQPFRRIKDENALLFVAAREAADRTGALEVEPAASYLIETLASVGAEVDEKRPLGKWMGDLAMALRNLGSDVPALKEPLASLVKSDALGLPVSWLRLHAGQEDPSKLMERAAEAVALPLAAEIDRGQWAAWIFREYLLDLRLGAKE